MARKIASVLTLSVVLAAALGAAADPPGGSTPREAMLGFLEASRQGNYGLASRYLDLRSASLPGQRLARQFKVVLDQTLWIDVDGLSDLPEGRAEDGLPVGVDSAGTIEKASPPVPVLLQRITQDGQTGWVVSAATVSEIPALYDEFGFGVLGEWLPSFFFDVSVLELELWQWIGLLILVPFAYVLGMLSSAAIMRIARRLVGRTETALDDLVLQAISAPLTLTLGIALFWGGSLLLRLSVFAQQRLALIAQGLIVVTLTWLAVRIVDVAAHTMRERLLAKGDTAAATIVPMGARVAKVFLFVIALLSALQNMGYNVTGLIAGLGIGGLAVALAAQKTFENFLGGVSVIADRPVQVGHFGRFGSWLGTVEEIGLRSTRIRTLDRTQVTIPNAQFSSMEIENFAPRDRIRFYATLGLRYETSADQLRHVLVGLKRLLVEHPRVLADPARVRFVAFGAFSLDLEIFAYLDTADWNEFLALREDLMLQIIDVVEASGTGFAFPSSTVYLGQDGGLDAERTAAAKRQAQRWRERDEPWLPGKPAAPDPPATGSAVE